MHLMKLLHKTFEKELPFVHQVRLNNVIEASMTLTRINTLSLTALGRHLPIKIKARSKIKKMDRLVGNRHLQSESTAFYQVMNRYLMAKNCCPWIHIDWSCVCAVTKMYLLRASLSMRGRSIVVYEASYPKKKENNHATHKAFLHQLNLVLPRGVKPVIVTDAGFRAPWFAHVRKLGWDFVGRLRNRNALQFSSSSDWLLSRDLYSKATGKPSHLGKGILTVKEQVPAHFVLYKGKPKIRRYLARGRRTGGSNRQRYRRAGHEPWLLVTSLETPGVEKLAVNIYRQRMRIEENFRDTKCTRYGFGLKESRSRCVKRMNVLLLIAAIATFCCWLAGLFTRQRGKAADFQAHSAKNQGVLSIVFLGREALREGVRVGARQFQRLLILLFELSIQTQKETATYE